VTLYIDSGATQTTLANPVSSDANGNFWFYSEDGIYDLKIEHPDISTIWLYGVEQIAFTEIEKTDNKNVANGYCGLGANGKVQTAQLNTDGLMPTGTIMMWGGSVAPSGWVLCDGTYYAYNGASYSALYAVIGYTYGQSSTNFRVPYFNGRSPIAAGGASGGTTRIRGKQIGAEGQTLVSFELPAHNHVYYATSQPEKTWVGPVWLAIPYGYVDVSATRYKNGYIAQWTQETGDTNGNVYAPTASHNNMHPSLVINYIIKL